jgi:ribosomal-protein-alanine N-acetyltransferase
MTQAAVFARFPRLETERLSLRRLRVADADALLRIFGDEAVTEFYDLPTLAEREQVLRIINRAEQSFHRQEGIRWGITRKEEDRVLGTIGLSFETAYRGGVGYDLARAYWRQGIMSEALGAVLAFAFEQAGLHRVQALVMPGNEASAGLLHKLGFTDEGILREYLFFKGAYQDLHCFSILRREFDRM